MARVIVLSMLVCALGGFGCASSADRESRTATVTQDELPTYSQLRRGTTAYIGVDGHSNQPRQLLVRKYDVPELTDDEKKTLGEKKPAFDPLALYDPTDPMDRGVYSERAFPVVQILGHGGGIVLTDTTLVYSDSRMIDAFSMGGAGVDAHDYRFGAMADPLPWQSATGIEGRNPVLVDIGGDTAHAIVDPTDDATR